MRLGWKFRISFDVTSFFLCDVGQIQFHIALEIKIGERSTFENNGCVKSEVLVKRTNI